MNIDAEIDNLYRIKWNIPFRDIVNLLNIISLYVEPVIPDLNKNKYLHHLIDKIDFDALSFNIHKSLNIGDILTYCDSIHNVLELELKQDIDDGIISFNNSISTLNERDCIEIQAKLIIHIGNIKLFTSKIDKEENFTKKYLELRKGIENRDSFFVLDYQLLIVSFKETIANYLERTLGVIVDTLEDVQSKKSIRILKPKRTKADDFSEYLENEGFFTLEKVECLTPRGQAELVELISKNKMPYGIAMFDLLGFLKFLDAEKGVQYKTHYTINRLYDRDSKDEVGTNAKRNRYALSKPNERYNSKKYKEIVIKDYQNIRKG